jgi:hypothetical protein
MIELSAWEEPAPFDRHTDKPQNALEQEIFEVQVQLDRLSRKQTQLKRELNERFCPVLQLPPEITTEIFNECYPSGVWIESNNSDFSTPFILGQVCGIWRTLAKSTSSIWCTISFDVVTTKVEFCQEWLARSRDSPLYVRLTHSPSSIAQPGIVTQQFLRCLVQSSERWRKIDFNLPESFFPHFSPVEGRIPQLTSISLVDQIFLGFHKIRAFSTAPQLRDLQLHSVCMPTFLNFNLPINQLTTLLLTSISSTACLEVLHDLPQLIHCIFKSVAMEDPWSLTKSTLAPRLESLAIYTLKPTGSHTLRLFFDNLTSPMLNNLTVDMEAQTSESLPHRSIISFIDRSSCKLERLTIHASIGGQELYDCLSETPSLIEFTQRIPPPASLDELLWILDPPHQWNVAAQNCLLPNLQKFRLYSTKWQIDFDDLVVLLCSRREKAIHNEVEVAQLDHVDIKIPCSSKRIRDGDAVSQLRDLREGGMCISISCNCYPELSSLFLPRCKFLTHDS